VVGRLIYSALTSVVSEGVVSFQDMCVCEGFVMCGCFGKCILYSD